MEPAREPGAEEAPSPRSAEKRFKDAVAREVPNQEVPSRWRSAIRHCHQMFGHPSNESLARVFQRSGAPPRLVEAVLSWCCPDCVIRSKPKAQRVATIPHARRPNEGVAVDAMFLTDRRRKPSS